jgi:gas vesicle protein
MASSAESQNLSAQQDETSQSLGERARQEADSARQELRHAGEAIRSEAQGIASTIRNKAMDGVESGKSALADSLDDFTAAIRKASDELNERDQQSAASLVREAASGLEHVTQAMKDRSVQDLAGSISTFARERPAMFFIGAALAGIALGRFARAHSPEPQAADRSEGGYNDY